MTHANSNELSPIRESLLAHIWKGQWLKKGPFPTSDGRMVRVRSAGRENKDSGPDFLSATIILDDEILTGDVELHLKSSDWRTHGHHLDPHFNGVILQVVLWDDAKAAASLQSGNPIPTLPLHDYLNGSMDDLSIRAQKEQAPLLPCRDAGHRLPDLEEVLDRYGLERLYVKSAFFETELILEEPPQVLYAGIMGALGYTKNKKPFQELARRLPLRVLESISLEHPPSTRKLVLQALLLGGAGLLPSQCGRTLADIREISMLEEAWQSLGIHETMTRADWHFFRMHPKNFPTRRLLGAAEILDRHRENGLLTDMMKMVNASRPDDGIASFERGFVVRDLIGPGRAREIVVNVVLPFSLGWGETSKQSELKEHIFKLYRTCPRLGENQITRYLSDLFWGNGNVKIVNSAQRQQGLIHLYKTFCQDGRCEACPMATARC